jgi:hypothetical protein
VTYKDVWFQIGHLTLTMLMITIYSGAVVNSHNYSLQFIALSIFHTQSTLKISTYNNVTLALTLGWTTLIMGDMSEGT